MKPSEYFLKERINNQRWFDEYDSERHAILDLDKRFIDREELKDKINKLFKNKKRIHDSIKCGNYIEYYDIGKQEILELLK